MIFNILKLDTHAMTLFHNMMKVKFPLLFLIFISLQIQAQEGNLPHLPGREEQELMNDYLNDKLNKSARSIPTPPASDVRTMAEWEPIQALIITWAGHSTILKEIVRNAVKECKVLIVTNNPGSVTTSLTDAGISLDSVQFVNTPFNSIWVRDYGPWSVYKNDVDSLYIIDWIYNRPRENDDAVPVAIANHLGLPIFEATVDPDDFVHTGGNHLPDGMGTAFSSMLVLEENNDKSEDLIDSIAKKYLGIHQYIKFPTLPYDGIHHLDMHMRLIDEETIIFGEYPDGVADGPQINENIEYLLSDFKTSFGNPYKIIRIPMPPQGNKYPDQGGDYRTYTNSIFINKTILVPTYEERYDTTALRIYRENLPGYNVVGINCNSIIPSLGALHCITKTVGTQEPLMIAHARLRDSDNPGSSYEVEAIIKHRNDIATADVYYRTQQDSTYQVVNMYLKDSINEVWSAVIPPHNAGVELQYFIHAKANGGKEQVRPIVAPEGYYKFRINGEVNNQPPAVNITYPSNNDTFSFNEESVTIAVDASDPDGFIDHLVVLINGDSVAVIDSSPYTYEWTFVSPGEFDISIKASDDKNAFTLSESVHISVESTTGTKESAYHALEAFPNPVHDMFWIESAGALGALTVSNVLGQIVSISQHDYGSSIGLDFSKLSKGVYYVKGNIGGKNFIYKAIKA